MFQDRNYFQPGYPLLKARPPTNRRGAQMKAPSERAPHSKYATGVLELQLSIQIRLHAVYSIGSVCSSGNNLS